MSKEITDSLSDTQLQLNNTRPQTWMQIRDKINLDHLSASQKHEALQMLHLNEQIFQLYTLDLGCTSQIQATINTDTAKPPITKYKPLPLNIRQNVHQILDHLVQYLNRTIAP